MDRKAHKEKWVDILPQKHLGTESRNKEERQCEILNINEHTNWQIDRKVDVQKTGIKWVQFQVDSPQTDERCTYRHTDQEEHRTKQKPTQTQKFKQQFCMCFKTTPLLPVF